MAARTLIWHCERWHHQKYNRRYRQLEDEHKLKFVNKIEEETNEALQEWYDRHTFKGLVKRIVRYETSPERKRKKQAQMQMERDRDTCYKYRELQDRKQEEWTHPLPLWNATKPKNVTKNAPVPKR